MRTNKTRINCSLTGCKYNSACCTNPADENNCYCTLKAINLLLDEDMGILDCQQFKYDHTKPYECVNCQLDKYGEIEVTPSPVFIEVDNIDDLLN